MEDDKKLEGPQNPDQKVENTQQDQEEAADKTVSNTVQVPAAQANTITNPTIANIKTEQIDQKQKPIIKTIEK
ncbi:MAG: hypothetical protein H6766_02030 [Candidatus Peribacteria bacterium]|nr:MAG: hypothetical protein H6766_02030 [Candidatus Peribacteria bacterium]